MFDRTEAPRRSRASMHPRFDEILTPEALAFVAKLDGAHSPAAAPNCWPPAASAASASPPASRSTSWPRPRRSATTPSWRVAPPAPGLADRRCEITGPTDPQDDHQRAELRRQGVDGRLRGRHRAELVQRHRRPAQPVSTRSAATWTSPTRTARSTRSATTTPTIVVRPRGWRLCEKHITHRRPAAARRRWSTSGCSSSTTRSS